MTETPQDKIVLTTKQLEDILFAASLSGVVAGDLMAKEVTRSFVAKAVDEHPGLQMHPMFNAFIQTLTRAVLRDEPLALIESFMAEKDQRKLLAPEFRQLSTEIVPGYFEFNSDLNFTEIWVAHMRQHFEGKANG